MKYFLTLLFFLTVINAATITWSYNFYGNSDPDGTTKNWNDPTNWDLGRVPATDDDVVIDQYVDTNGIDDFVIQLPSSVTVKSLTHPASLISIEGPGTLTVSSLSVTKGIFRDLDIVVSNDFVVDRYVTFNEVSLTIESGATFSCPYDVNIELGEGTTWTNNGVMTVGGNAEFLSSDYSPLSPATNSKFINNGQIIFDGSGYNTRFHALEYEQSSSGSISVRGGETVTIQVKPGSVPSGVEDYTGAPGSWDGSIEVQSGSTLEIIGGEIAWSSSITFNLAADAVLHLAGFPDFRSVQTFAGDFQITQGIVAVNVYTDITVAGTMALANLEWRGGNIVNTDLSVDHLSCAAPFCCYSTEITLDGGHLTLTGESDMSDCRINLDNGATFEVAEDAVVNAKEGYLFFWTETLTAPGTFLNNGRVVMMPQNPISGTHRWFDVSVDNRGSFECLRSVTYEYCMGIMHYYGSTAESVSTGVFNISSTVTDFKEDGVLELHGHWNFKEGHQFAGGSVTTLAGDSGTRCEDISQQVCDNVLVMTFETGTTYTTESLRVEARIRLYTEGDMVLDYVEWTGGYWGGSGLVTVTEEMSLANEKLGSGAEMYLANKQIEIEKKLVLTYGFITGVNGAEIIIRPGAEMEWMDSGRLGIQDEDAGSDLTLTNEGNISFIFDDRFIYSGVVNIVNKGLMQMKEVDSSYSDSDVTAAFGVEEGATIRFEEEGTLVIRIRANREYTYQDDEELSDFFEMYEAASCILGGTLQLEFVQPSNCFPSCDELVIEAGSKWNIMHHRFGDKINEGLYPCYGDFSSVEVTGLPAGLKVGILYNEEEAGSYSDSAYIVAVVCAESDAVCGSSNKYQSSGATTTGTGTETGGNNNSVSIAVVFGLMVLALI